MAENQNFPGEEQATVEVPASVWLQSGGRTFEVTNGSDMERRLISEGFEYCDAPEVLTADETGEPEAVTGRSGKRRQPVAIETPADAPPIEPVPENTDAPTSDVLPG